VCTTTLSCHSFFFFFLVLVGIEPSTLNMVRKYSTPELPPQPPALPFQIAFKCHF
jgi:hypothetical protein